MREKLEPAYHKTNRVLKVRQRGRIILPKHIVKKYKLQASVTRLDYELQGSSAYVVFRPGGLYVVTTTGADHYRDGIKRCALLFPQVRLPPGEYQYTLHDNEIEIHL